MPAKTLAEKMKLKPDAAAAILNPPPGYLETLAAPPGVQTGAWLEGSFDWLQVFVQNRAELEKLAPHLPGALRPGGLLWITFPKGSSKIQTDLSRDKGWESLEGLGLKWTNLISVDETWSAFSLRPFKPGEDQKTWR